MDSTNILQKIPMRGFKKLKVWSQGMDIVKFTYDKTEEFPDKEKFGLTQQMRRASVSIPSNIAEGCKGSTREFIHFLKIALGSSYELLTQFTISFQLGFLTKSHFTEAELILVRIQKQIIKFIGVLKS